MMIAAVASEDESRIDIAFVEIPVEIGGGEADAHIGEAALEIMELGDQPFKRNGDIDLDRQLVVGGGRAQGYGLRLDLIESLAHDRVIGFPRRGQFGLSCLAGEESDADRRPPAP